MAGLSSTPAVGDPGVRLTFDDDCDATIVSVGTGPIIVDCIFAESAEAAVTYLHLWDQADAVMGTTPQDDQYELAATSEECIVFPGGRRFSQLSIACTTDKGTAASSDPGTPIDVHVVYRVAEQGGGNE